MNPIDRLVILEDEELVDFVDPPLTLFGSTDEDGVFFHVGFANERGEWAVVCMVGARPGDGTADSCHERVATRYEYYVELCRDQGDWYEPVPEREGPRLRAGNDWWEAWNTIVTIRRQGNSTVRGWLKGQDPFDAFLNAMATENVL